MDFVRSQAELRALKQAGLSRDEDLFASPVDSAFNRWPWLAINLVTAFLASRVIGQFEHTIRDLSALAALMPIVASIGGNTGNQTMAIMIRALGGDQVRGSSAMRLLNKELLVGLLNGSIWGVVVGLVAVLIYANYALGAGHDRGGGVEPRCRGGGRRRDSVRPALDRDAIRHTARACC